jgi:HSP20 family molecular chaperone IbpA
MAMLFPDPFDNLFQFQQALDAFRTSGWLGSGPSGSGAYPPLNVFRKGDDVVVIAEVPGIRKSDLEIQVKGNTIRIAGGKTVQYGDTAALHRRERVGGASTARSPCPLRSMRTMSRPSAVTAFWPSISRALSGISRNRSPWDKRATAS